AFVVAAVLAGAGAVYWSVGTGFGPGASSDASKPVEQAQSDATVATATDSSAARAHTQALIEEAEWTTAARSVSAAAIRELAERDPQAAAERSLADSEQLQRLVAREWERRDPQGLLSFAREHIGSERHGAFVHAAVRLQHRLDADA